MAVTLITGPKKSGKTSYILNELKKESNGAFIIVPEQNLFYYEKKILEVLGEAGAFLSETISFRKLALRLLENNDRYGILKLLDKETKYMMVASVILKNRDSLRLYKSNGKTDYITAVTNQISEFKKHLITADMLLEVINSEETPDSLKDKLSDLSLILSEYDSMSDILTSSDGDDLLTSAAKLLANTHYFRGKKVYIDGFTGFTAQELYLIEAIHSAGADIYISLDYTSENSKLIGDIYYSVGLTKKKIEKIFEITGEVKTASRYFYTPEAEHIAMNMFINKEKYNKEIESISLKAYKTPLSEARYAASFIASELEKGASPGDFQIVAGDFEGSLPYLSEALNNFNIPFYAEEKVPVSSLPVYTIIESVFRLLLKPSSSAPAISYLKNICRTPKMKEKSFIFEKFIRASGIRGYSLVADGGADKLISEAYNFPTENEKEIREIYDKYFKPLSKLSKRISGKNSAEHFATSLYGFFKEIELEKIVRETAKDYEYDGDTDAAFKYVQVYNSLIETLEKSCLILGEEQTDFIEFKNIILENLSNKSIAGIPLGYDNVFITGMHGISPDIFKYVYIINANDGVLISNSPEGMINEDDRKHMKNFGIELSLSPEAKTTEEYLKILTLLTSYSKKLVISHHLYGYDGEEKKKSDIFEYLSDIFDTLSTETSLEEIYSERSLLTSGLMDAWGENLSLAAKKLSKASESPVIGAASKELVRSFALPPHTEIEIPDAESIMPDKMTTSVTALEKFRSCGYAYYIKYILRGKEPDIYSVNNADIGLLSHLVLQKFSEKIIRDGKSFSDIDDDYTDSALKPIIKKAVSEVNNGIFKSGGRAVFISKRVHRSVKRTLKLIKEHFTKGSFKEYGFEVTFGKPDSTLPGLEIELDNNRKVILSGTIDRVDTLKTDEGEYIRIIDYKSSAKTLDLYEIYYGLSLQLTAYLMVMLESKINEKLLPGGILYLSLENPMITIKDNPSSEVIEASVKKELVMQGILLKNEKLISAMDSEFAITGNSEIIKISLNKQKELTSKNNLTLSEFALVFEKLTENIKQNAQSIYGGKFHIRPVRKAKKTGCAYCPYGAICGFDEKLCKTEDIAAEAAEDILKKLKEYKEEE